MTIQEHIENNLVCHGLWPKEAEEIMEKIKDQESEENGSMTYRWNDKVEDYPLSFSQFFGFLLKTKRRNGFKKTNLTISL